MLKSSRSRRRLVLGVIAATALLAFYSEPAAMWVVALAVGIPTAMLGSIFAVFAVIGWIDRGDENLQRSRDEQRRSRFR